MSSDFNWWLLLVGIVVGVALAWLVLADFGPADDAAEGETDRQLEADWVAARFAERGQDVDRRVVADVLDLDRIYRHPDGRLAPTQQRMPRPEAPAAAPAERTHEPDGQLAAPRSPSPAPRSPSPSPSPAPRSPSPSPSPSDGSVAPSVGDRSA